MAEGTSEDVSKGVDAEAYKAGPIPELDEIRRLDSQLHTREITPQEQGDARAKLNDLIPKMSERFGIPSEVIMAQLDEERHLQGVDGAAETLTRVQRQFETLVKVGASPETITKVRNDIKASVKSPEPQIPGPAISNPTQTSK